MCCRSFFINDYSFRQVYGQDPLDIARFGVLPPCSRKGRHRCVEPRAHQDQTGQQLFPTPPPLTVPPAPRTESPAHRSGPPPPLLAVSDQNIRLVPCVERGKCPGQEALHRLLKAFIVFMHLFLAPKLSTSHSTLLLSAFSSLVITGTNTSGYEKSN